MAIQPNFNLESFLGKEFNWLQQIITLKYRIYFENFDKNSIYDINVPLITNGTSYEQFLLQYDLGFKERVIICMISASIFKPEIFDVFLLKNKITGMPYSEFGGIIENRRFNPTFRTAAFILNETNNSTLKTLLPLFEQEHPFSKFSILEIPDTTFSRQIDLPMQFRPEAEYLLFRRNKS